MNVLEFVKENGSSYESQEFSVSPQEAEVLMERNVKNRPISKIVVERYAETMKKGRWRMNGQSILFDKEGNLLDGQHRLLAIIKSGVTIRTSVAKGLGRETFATIDNGRKRNVGQLIGMDVKNYNAVGAVVRAYAHLKAQGHIYSCEGRFKTNQRQSLTNDEMMELYYKNANIYNHYGAISVKLGHEMKKPPITATLMVAYWVYLVYDLGYKDEFVAEFVNQLYSQLPTTTNETLRTICKKFRRWREDDAKLPTYVMMNYIAKAWNYYAIGREVKVINIGDVNHVDFISAQQAEDMK